MNQQNKATSVEETSKARDMLAAATWWLRRCRDRYQGDPINRAVTLDARAKYIAARRVVYP